MQAVLEDIDTAPIRPELKVLLRFIDKTAQRSVTVTREDVGAVRAAGWSDEAIYDAITVCSLFRFYNTWIDATGVSALADYTPSAQRLAQQGYTPSESS